MGHRPQADRGIDARRHHDNRSAAPHGRQAYRDRFNVVVRTVNELQGVLCVAWETEPLDKQQTIAPRSFGGPLYTPEALAEPVHLHAGRVAVYLPPFRVVFLLAISLSDTNR